MVFGDDDLEGVVVEPEPHRSHHCGAVLKVGPQHGGRWRLEQGITLTHRSSLDTLPFGSEQDNV